MTGRIEVENKIEQRILRKLKDQPDYVYDWYLNLKANKATSTTCYDYLNKVIQMLNYYGNKPSIEDLSQRKTIEYFNSIQKIEKDGEIKSSSISYQQSVWCALVNFFDYLFAMKLIPNNYMATIKRPKNNNDDDRVKKERILLTQQDFNLILKAVKRKPKEDELKWGLPELRSRNVLLMCLFMTTGIRKTALSEINIEDIDFDTHELVVIDKGNKYHVYALSDDMMTCIKNWLADREKIIGDSDCDALFISENGTRLSTNRIFQIVEKYSEEALGYKISPHKLRAGFCSILYNVKHDIEFVRRTVGHSNIRTTQRYIVTDNNERKEAANIMSDLLKF